MRLIAADKIKFTEYINGDVTVSKEEIQNMPTVYELNEIMKELKKEAFVPDE